MRNKYKNMSDFNSTTHFLRQAVHPWRLQSRLACNNQSFITGVVDNSYKMSVHHPSKMFSDIVQEAHKELNIISRHLKSEYSLWELEALADKVLELHFAYGLGVLLEDWLHREYHRTYKIVDVNTLAEFKSKYQNIGQGA